MMRNSALVLIFLLLGCHSMLADETAYINHALAEFLEEKLLLSSQVVIQHIPNIAIGSRLWERENIVEDWKYKMVLNCRIDCGGRTASLMKEIARQSIKQVNECPLPLNTLVRLMDDNGKSVLDMYFHQSGHCFMIGEQSYFSKRKFDPLKDFVRI